MSCIRADRVPPATVRIADRPFEAGKSIYNPIQQGSWRGSKSIQEELSLRFVLSENCRVLRKRPYSI